MPGCACVTAGCSRTAGAGAAATGVSTTGEKFGAGEVGISSGLAGLPAAYDPGGTAAGCVTAVLAAASFGLGPVASIPAIAGAVVLVLASATLPLAAAGLPAAYDPGGTAAGCVTAVLATASSGLGPVASIPAIAGAVLWALAPATLPLAAAAPGIGLGSIAGLDSV